jgi:hypothetical protein
MAVELIDGLAPEEFLAQVKAARGRGRPPKDLAEKVARAESIIDARKAAALEEATNPKIIVEKVESQFRILRVAGEQMIAGNLTGLSVSGAPGIGKTHTLDQEVFQPAAKKGLIKYRAIKGATTPVQLVKVLYEQRTRESVTLMDDNDSIFEDRDALNVLKAALDSYPVRRISWLSSTDELDEDQKDFLFEGKVAFITNRNLKVEAESDKKSAVDIAAFLDRVKYMDLKLHSKAARAAWVVHIIRTTGMLTKRPEGQKSVTKAQSEAIAKYIEAHWTDMRSASLRTAGHMADLVHMVKDVEDAKSWRDLVEAFSL